MNSSNCLRIAVVLCMVACGDVTISAPTNPECQVSCRQGEVCLDGLCVDAAAADAGPGTSVDGGPIAQPADAGPVDPPASDAGVTLPGGDGQSAETAATSCQDLLAANPGTASDVF